MVKRSEIIEHLTEVEKILHSVITEMKKGPQRRQVQDAYCMILDLKVDLEFIDFLAEQQMAVKMDEVEL